MRAREAAYQAVLNAWRENSFAAHTLRAWEQAEHPDRRELSLAWEIAHGTLRRMLTLDHFAKQCAARSKLTLKLKERVLLDTALYQYVYMSKIPLYALVNETVELAHRYCHVTFTQFLNAILHKLSSVTL